MEEHLEVAVHVASVALVHQAIEITAILLLPAQREHNEDIGLGLGFEPDHLGVGFALQRPSARLDDLGRDLVLAEPRVLPVNDQNGLGVIVLAWGLELADQVAAVQLDLDIDGRGLDPSRHALLVALHREDGYGHLEDQPRHLQVEGLEQHQV